MKLNVKVLMALVALPILVSCTGHPAAGKWQLQSTETFEFNRLVINFDGRAELYKPDSDTAWFHCFWNARAADTIAMECASADETQDNELFDFKVSGKSSGQLLQANKLLARFENKILSKAQ
ncbi:MAG: hypothetical protein HRU24_10900 [Gammaproteobacteria bacterium]|nr:hypothetical protein [Gammaproteobacteria bacterium]